MPDAVMASDVDALRGAAAGTARSFEHQTRAPDTSARVEATLYPFWRLSLLRTRSDARFVARHQCGARCKPCI